MQTCPQKAAKRPLPGSGGGHLRRVIADVEVKKREKCRVKDRDTDHDRDGVNGHSQLLREGIRPMAPRPQHPRKLADDSPHGNAFFLQKRCRTVPSGSPVPLRKVLTFESDTKYM